MLSYALKEWPLAIISGGLILLLRTKTKRPFLELVTHMCLAQKALQTTNYHNIQQQHCFFPHPSNQPDSSCMLIQLSHKNC